VSLGSSESQLSGGLGLIVQRRMDAYGCDRLSYNLQRPTSLRSADYGEVHPDQVNDAHAKIVFFRRQTPELGKGREVAYRTRNERDDDVSFFTSPEIHNHGFLSPKSAVTLK
jgi:hypothetical protein